MSVKPRGPRHYLAAGYWRYTVCERDAARVRWSRDPARVTCPACQFRQGWKVSEAGPLHAVSLFGGVEGFGLGLLRAGIEVRAVVEIDPECQSVIRRHFPDVTILDDVQKVTADDLRRAGAVPARTVLCYGFPCTDISLAGRRGGMGEGTESGLFWHADRIVSEFRPAWLIAENVPGLLSATCPCPGDETCLDNGRPVDRRGCGRLDKPTGTWIPAVMHHPAGGACPGGCVPAHGGTMGAVLGAVGDRGYGYAYRVLDARHFGLAQRRPRVFIVGNSRDWSAPCRVLLESDRGEGAAAPGGPAGPGAAADAGGAAGGDRGTAGALITPGRGGRRQVSVEAAAGGQLQPVDVVSTLQASGGGRAARRGHRLDAESAAGGQLIAATLTAGGHSPGISPPGRRSEDDVNLVAMSATGQDTYGTVTSHEGAKGGDSDATTGLVLTGTGGGTDTARALIGPAHGRRNNDSDENWVAVRLHGRDGGNTAEHAAPGEPAFTIAGSPGGSSRAMVANALTPGTHGRGTSGYPEESAGHLIGVAEPMGFASSGLDPLRADGLAPPVKAAMNGTRTGSGPPGMVAASDVRRLTPLECERLQGFPDNWTAFGHDGKPMSDSARYRMTGNAVPVPVTEWIGRRVAAVDRGEL